MKNDNRDIRCPGISAYCDECTVDTAQDGTMTGACEYALTSEDKLRVLRRWKRYVKTFIATVRLPKSEVSRVNRLLCMDDNMSEMTDSELRKIGASQDTNEGIFSVEFDDGSTLTYDLCSGQENYYDNIVWTSAQKDWDIPIDCTFELNDFEFDVDGTIYKVKIIEE